MVGIVDRVEVLDLPDDDVPAGHHVREPVAHAVFIVAADAVHDGVRICLIARTSPADWGITAFPTWSLTKLREYLIARGTVAAISRETLRRILRR